MYKKIIEIFLAIFILVITVYAQGTSQTKPVKEITAQKIIENYINAIGGRQNILKVKDRTTFLRGNLMGKYISITIYQKAPDKMRQIINAGQFKQNIFYDGVKGQMTAGGKAFDIKGSQLESLKYESTLYMLVELDSLGIKLKLEGLDTLDGTPLYKLYMIFPSGTKWTEYFDPNTWLKIEESKEVVMPKGTYVRETFFSDYREVDGVKYPFDVEQKMGNQKVDYVVSSVKTNAGLNDDLFTIK